MKSRFVSAAALLICCAILAAVILFGYSRYKAAQEENAAFGAKLGVPAPDATGPLATQMPQQLPPRATSASENPAASPQPAGH
jgi:hypothetical protein